MHVIQIQTIGAWKGAQERSRKTILMVFINSWAFYKEWVEFSMDCVATVNHKCVIYWVINYRTMKYVLEKHDGWHGAMVWPHRALVKSWEGLIYVVIDALHKPTITEEVQCFREGNHQDWRGIQISVLVCPWVFSTMNINPANHRVQIWHFFGFIYNI